MNEITAQGRDTSTPATPEQITQALALLTSLPRRRDDESTGRLNLEAYRIALKGVTRYGLNLATQAALKGEHGNGFFPSPAELRRLYEAGMKPVHEYAEKARRLAAQAAENARFARKVEEPTPEQKARVKAKIEEFKAKRKAEDRGTTEFDWSTVYSRFDQQARAALVRKLQAGKE